MKRLSSYPLPQWHQHQGATNDCGPFSAAIVINALHGEKVVEAERLARQLEKRSGLRLPGRIPHWATFPWGLVRLFPPFGLQARWQWHANEAHLLRDIEDGVAVIVLVGDLLHFENGRWKGWMHYKVLYGKEEEAWLFVDPAERQPIHRQATEVFTRRWRNAARQIIEVWRP